MDVKDPGMTDVSLRPFPVSPEILEMCRQAALDKQILGGDNAAIYQRMAEFARDLPAAGGIFSTFFSGPALPDRDAPAPDLVAIGNAYWNRHGGSLTEKRQRGSFYTPLPVIDRVLSPVIDSLTAGRRLRGTVADPALGCGYFHLRLIELLRQSGKYSDGEIACWAAENLYGVDIDDGAVFLARTFLWLALSGPNREYLPVPGRYMVGDALLGHVFHDNEVPAPESRQHQVVYSGLDWGRAFPEIASAGGFDMVIGNPPYEVLTNFSKHPERRLLAQAIRQSRWYRDSLGRQVNLYRCFIERSLDLLRPGGRLAFVVPMSLARDVAAAPLRKRLLLQEDARDWTFFSERDRLFPGVTQSLCIFSARRDAGPAPSVTLRSGDASHALPLARLGEDARLPAIQAEGLALYAWLEEHCPGRVGDVAEMRVGEVDQTVYRECMTEIDTGCLLARGCHLRPFHLDTEPGGKWRYLHEDRFLEMKGKARDACLERVNRDRVVQLGIRNLSSRPRLVAAVAPRGVHLGNSLNVYYPRDGMDSRLLAGILNSRLLDWLFSINSGNNNINLYEMATLPFPVAISPDNAAAIITAYDQAAADALSGNDISESRRQLDCAVQAAYGIPDWLAVPGG